MAGGDVEAREANILPWRGAGGSVRQVDPDALIFVVSGRAGSGAWPSATVVAAPAAFRTPTQVQLHRLDPLEPAGRGGQRLAGFHNNNNVLQGYSNKIN